MAKKPTALPQMTDLAPIDRARHLLMVDQRKQQLTDLAKSSERITEITNADGLKECHSARMALKNTRIDIEKAGKAAREDATAFSKAVISAEKELIGVITPEEQRLEKIQNEYESAREAERIAKARAAQELHEAGQRALDSIRQIPLTSVGQSAERVAEFIESLRRFDLDEVPNGVREQAAELIPQTLEQLERLHADKLSAENEAKRLAEERAELDRQRQQRETEERERAESDRKKREAEDNEQRARLKKEREEHETKMAADQAELKAAREKLEAEQTEQRRIAREEEDRRAAAERKRLDEEAKATREAETKRLEDERTARLDRLRAGAGQLVACAMAAVELLTAKGLGDHDVTIQLGFAIENESKQTKKAA